MKKYCEMSREELLDLKKELDREFDEIKAEGLALDMSRGKPAPDQLDLSMKMMEVLAGDADLKCETGVDCRNYGVIDGIPEAKRLLGEMSEVEPENIIIYGNSSLNVMFDTIARSYSHGVMGNTPWCKLDKVKFLCPVPGYDRHFRITEFFGIEMINIPMSPEGPDMDMVEKYVNEDPAVKGIWCVPKYSNPQGYTYSEETVKRFAHLKPAAPDFRIYWDNAYSIHHLYDDNQDFLLEILDECAKAGNPDIVYKFTSTSKVSFPGSGIAAVAASKANLDDFRKYMTVQTIGHDKLNQLRHVRFFKDINGLHEHMRKHADILRPKFELVLATLDKELNGLGIGEWTKPHGGYFISFDAMEGCAKAIVAKAKEAGVVMTGAGATYPYGKDPKDSNIRIAPSYPSVEELGKAAEVFVLCVKLVSVEKLLENLQKEKDRIQEKKNFCDREQAGLTMKAAENKKQQQNAAEEIRQIHLETGKEVLETIILKQEIEQLYRAYEACLKETEKIVLRSRYGLFGGKEQTQREIARHLHISRSYVSRIEKNALRKLRTLFPEKQ